MLFLLLLGLGWALTPQEIAQFKPRLPNHVERNTGLKANYTMTDNGDGTHTFWGTDVPPHDTWKYPQNPGNPHELKAQNMTFKFNKHPIFRKDPITCMPHGMVGVSTSGVMISANWADETGCPYARDFEELDICDGHPSPFNEYHHHYYAHCIVQPVCGEPSPIVGVAMDGIPIYGPWDENGRQLTQQDLDECGGRVDNEGRYKYIMTKDPPFFMRCLRGELRNDLALGQDWDTRNFFCSCPYDDSYAFNRDTDPSPRPDPDPHPDPGPRPRPRRQPDPPKPRPQICEFSGAAEGMAVCNDKWNTSYTGLNREWAYETVELELAPCCPKGADCGFSCKTEEGIKSECFVEKRTVRVIENEEKGYCKKKCKKECKSSHRKRVCYNNCYNQCQTGFGQHHVR